MTEGADIIGMSICLSAYFVPKTQISTGLWKIKKICKAFQFAIKFMLNFNLWPKKDMILPKGQLISEQKCGDLKFSKNATKYC